MNDLKTIREAWEKGLEVITEFQPNRDYAEEIVVVLKSSDTENRYHIHRYFLIGFNLQVSIDEQGDIETCLKALGRVYPLKERPETLRKYSLPHV